MQVFLNVYLRVEPFPRTRFWKLECQVQSQNIYLCISMSLWVVFSYLQFQTCVHLPVLPNFFFNNRYTRTITARPINNIAVPVV